VGGGLLDIPQRDPGVESCGDERVPERVGPYRLGDPSVSGHAAHGPRGAVPVQAVAVSSQEDRYFAAFTDGQVNRPRRARRQRDDDHLAALAGDGQRPVPAFHA
jgi:hypothetical protein